MQSLNRGAMAVLLALATLGMLLARGHAGARQQGLAIGGHSSAAFLAPMGRVPSAAASGSAAAVADLTASTAVLRKQEEAGSFAPGVSTGAAAAVAVLAVFAAKAAAGRRRTARRATKGDFMRDHPDLWAKFGEITPKQKRMWYQGEFGMTTNNGPSPKFEMPPPARQSMSEVSEALASYIPSQFYMESAASLKFSGVKQVGSYSVGVDGAFSAPAQVKTYVRPHRMGVRFEQEKGPKRTPLETEAYDAYMAKRCCVAARAQEASSKCGFSLDKDFICHRDALTVLLQYLNEEITGVLRKFGQAENPIDFVKISKGPNGKGLVLDSTFEFKNLTAEGRPYNGGWKRSERSEKGNFLPAWQRLASGDEMTTCRSITGLVQVCGTSAGKEPEHYRFVEYELGGMSFLTQAPVHLDDDGKNVELRHKNNYYRSTVKAMKVYYELLLGGGDMQSIAFHRSGKLVEVFEASADAIVEKMPNVVEAAENRLGRLVSLLSKVKAEIEKSGSDGPWALQWQDGELVLGSYVKVEEVEKAEEKELTMA